MQNHFLSTRQSLFVYDTLVDQNYFQNNWIWMKWAELSNWKLQIRIWFPDSNKIGEFIIDKCSRHSNECMKNKRSIKSLRPTLHNFDDHRKYQNCLKVYNYQGLHKLVGFLLVFEDAAEIESETLTNRKARNGTENGNYRFYWQINITGNV